jgi:hypothetical protein
MTLDPIDHGTHDTLLQPLVFQGFARYNARAARVLRHKGNLGGRLYYVSLFNFEQLVTQVGLIQKHVFIEWEHLLRPWIDPFEHVFLSVFLHRGDDAGTVSRDDTREIESGKEVVNLNPRSI